jgi:fibronectin type 3 domain-containing protein
MNIALSWKAVPWALGYVIYRSTSAGGPFNFPNDFVKTTPQSNYLDTNLGARTTYYYQVTAVNAAGISPPANVTVP